MTFVQPSSSKNRSNRSKNRPQNSFVPSMESLESRQLMAVDMVGVVRGNGQWLLDTNSDASHDIERSFGTATDRVVSGKWNGRLDSPGVVRNGRDGLLYWLFDTDGDSMHDQQIAFGRTGDQIVVSDWNGDGRDNVGVVRANTAGELVWYLDLNGDALAEITFTFGRVGQTAVAGDWDGDGRASAGVVNTGADGMLHWLLDVKGDGATSLYIFGLSGDQPMPGDWDNDGRANMGVVRAEADGYAHWYLDTNGDKWAEQTRLFGFASDRFVVGAWQPQNPLDGEPRPATKLSATLSTTGTLLIDGTNSIDTIDLRQSRGQVSLAGTSIVYKGMPEQSITASRVQRVEIRSFGGNDVIRLNGGSQEITVPTMIAGGDGDDVITGGAGADVIYGGAKIDACTDNTRLLVGDFDGNGRPDLLFYSEDATYGLTVRTHLSKDDGGYSVHTSVLGDGAAGGPLLIADLNGDGKDELIHHYFDHIRGLVVRVKEISAGGTWTSRQYVLGDGQSGTQLLAGNLFGDRRDELIYYTFDAKFGMIVRAKSLNPDGSWSIRQWITGDGATSLPLMAGDVTGDKFDDLVYAAYDRTRGLVVRVKSLNAVGAWTNRETVFGDGSNQVPLELADVTNDGLADLLYGYVDKTNNLILRTKVARADGSWDRNHAVIPNAGQFRELVVGSVDANSTPDVSIVTNGDSGLVVRSYLPQTNGSWATQTLYVGDRADVIRGGAGNDTIVAGNAADEIFGDAGDDVLHGGDGNDRLRGGHGVDKLFGGPGHDGLFGGVEDGAQDFLVGGSGADRLLSPWNEFVESEDTLIRLKSSPARDANIYGFAGSKYTAGTWSDAKVLQVDQALHNVHMTLGQTTLLKHGGASMTLFAIGDLIGVPSNFTLWGWNDYTTNAIYLTNAAFANPSTTLHAVYHELAHNWDERDENAFIPAFHSISRWDEQFAVGDTASHADGDNWYFRDTSTNFARDYGMWSPYEDYATTWESYFMNKFHGGSSNRTIASKIANVEQLFASLV